MNNPKQMTLDALRAEIERLDAAATKGPWHADDFTSGSAPYVWSESDVMVAKTWHDDKAQQVANRDFIALARTALPELLRRLLVAEDALESIAESGWGIKTNPTATNALAEIRGNDGSEPRRERE